MTGILYGKLKELNSLRETMENQADFDEVKRITEVSISEYLHSVKRKLKQLDEEGLEAVSVTMQIDENMSKEEVKEIQEKIREMEGVEKALIHKRPFEDLVEDVEANFDEWNDEGEEA